MRNKLFALEELEDQVEVVDLEAEAEVGEVADVQVEVEEEVADVANQEAAIAEGVEAADQLEEIEGVVEASIEEGEGLDPVAAEAMRIAVEAICARVGANPKTMYALYATENFQGASSRKANTRIALESVQDFLKNLWTKIKAAVSNIWTKIVEFWNKHVSNLARVLKALESMKSKIANVKGSPSHSGKDAKASGGLQSAFPGKGDVSADAISKFVSTHVEAGKAAEGILAAPAATFKANTSTPEALAAAIKNSKEETIQIGDENSPLAGGSYLKFVLEVDGTGDDEKMSLKVRTEEESVTGEKDRDLFVANKDKLKGLVESTTAVIKATIKRRDDVTKANKAFEDAKKAIDKAVGAMEVGENDEAGKTARRKAAQALRAFSTLHSKSPGIAAKVAAADVRLAKGVLSYCGACLSNYSAG